MSVCRLYDRAGVTTATAGTGTVTLGSAISNAYFTFANAGVQDQDTVRYVIDDGNDFEIGEGVYTAAGTTLTRATVIRSNIAGVQGNSKLTLSGSATVRIDCSRADLIPNTLLGQQFAGMVNGKITASVASNALTLNVKTLAGADPTVTDPVIFVFRNSTLATGDYLVYRVTAALNIVVSSSATLGHVSARDQQLILYVIDNAGTVELAVATKFFDQSARRISTTVMSGSATDPATMYSTAARTNVAWYPIARCVSNQTTSGTWTAVPTQIDLAPFTLPTNAVYIDLGGTDQTGIVTSTFTKVQLNHVNSDPDSCFDAVTNFRYQPKVPGKFAVTVCGLMQSVPDQAQFFHAVFKNGSELFRTNNQYASGTSGLGNPGAVQVDMNGTSDFLEFFVQHTVGSNKNLLGLALATYFTAQRIGP